MLKPCACLILAYNQILKTHFEEFVKGKKQRGRVTNTLWEDKTSVIKMLIDPPFIFKINLF